MQDSIEITFPYPELRAEASRMIWVITRQLKTGMPDTRDPLGQAMMEAYVGAMDWLAGTVVDDWGDISMVLELLDMPTIPLSFDGHPGSQWNAFVEYALGLARNAGVKTPEHKPFLPKAKPYDVPEAVQQSDWFYYGQERSWVKWHKNILTRRTTFSLVDVPSR